MKKIYFTITTLVAIISALAFACPSGTLAHDKHRQQRNQPTTSDHVRRRAAKARKRVRQHTVNYACPMHPDMRSQSRGECPKCGMDLVTEKDKQVKR